MTQAEVITEACSADGVEAESVPLPSKWLALGLQQLYDEAEEELDPELIADELELPKATSDADAPVRATEIPDDVTTLVLKDIPYNLTVSDMQDELELLGFTNSVNLIHFAKRKKFMGYAFVNFISADEARRFAQVFVNYRFEGNTSTKRSNVHVAHIQGLKANVAVLRRGYERAGNVYIDPSSAALLGAYQASAHREAAAAYKYQAANYQDVPHANYASWQNYQSYQGYHQSYQGYHLSYQGYETPWASYNIQ